MSTEIFISCNRCHLKNHFSLLKLQTYPVDQLLACF